MRWRSIALIACFGSTACAGTSLEPQEDEPTAGAAGSSSAGSSSAGSSSAGNGSAGSNPSNPSNNQVHESCGVAGALVEADAYTLELVTTQIQRRWAYCTGFQIGGPHDGIELVEGGSWYLLERDAEGELVRIGGFDGGGTWSVLDTTGVNGPGPLGYQINLDTSRGGFGAFAYFQTEPLAMRLSTMNGPIDYVAEEP